MSKALWVKNHENHSVFEGLQNSFERDRYPAISFHKPTYLKFSKAYETIFLNLWQEIYYHIS